MRPTSLRLPALLVSATAALAGAVGYAQRPVISQHIPQIVRTGQARYVSATGRGETLHLTIQLPSRNQDKLNALIAELHNPQSPNYRHWLTSQEFDIEFGPAREDFNTLVGWAQSKGLAVTYQASNGRLIEAEGTVETVNRAFHIVETNFHDSKLNRDFHSPDREPTTDLPFALLGVDGLEDSQPKINHLLKGPNPEIPSTVAAPVSTRNSLGLASVTNGLAVGGAEPVAGKQPKLLGSGPSGSYLPSDMRNVYYGGGYLTGAGQTVGIFSFDGYNASDLTLYYKSTGMTSTVPVNNVLVAGYAGTCFSASTGTSGACDDGEQILDIAQVQGMAPGLTQILFYEGTSANAVLNQMANDNTAKVISCSWGGGDFGAASDTYFQKMAAQGQSFLNATGDSGAFYSGNYAAPSLDPYITQVGGTVLATASAGGAWSSEYGWRDSGGGYWISGIPSSGQYAIPAWQQTSGVVTAANGASSTYRNVPDIAAEADFDNPTVSNGVFLNGYGGTSFAAPRMAGYVALALQQALANGQTTTGLGLINPSMYTAGLTQQSGGTAVFHDSTSGFNPAYPAGSPTYSSVAGYDLVTGWGSPNGAGLVNALAGNPAATFSIPTTFQASVVRGNSVLVSMPVTGYNGYSGAIHPASVTGLPAGWTWVYTSNTGTPSQPLLFSLSAPGTAGVGTYPVTVTVADNTNAAMTQTTIISVVLEKRANGDFTMSIGGGVTIPKGSTGTAFIQVTPGSGLADVVNLSVTTTIPGVTPSFFDPLVQEQSPKNVPLTLAVSGAATPGSYSLTVTGSNAAGIVHTVQLPVTITTPTSLLANGGFETGGFSPWLATTSCSYSPIALTSSSGFEAQTGNYFAVMLGTGSACTQTINQTVAIPTGPKRATLGLWVWILTAQTGSTAVDTLTVNVVDTSGIAHKLGSLSNLNAGGYWSYVSYDVTSYIGKTVTINFTAVEAGTTLTDVLLDNVTLVTQ